MDSRLRALDFVPAKRRRTGDVEDVQRRSWAPLPVEYLAFLLEYGGGDFDRLIVVRCLERPPQAWGDGPLFEGFFTVGAGSRSLAAAWRLWNRLEQDRLIPFGEGAGGNLYCFPFGRAEVVYWDHESGLVYRVAASLSDMLGRLVRAPDPPPGEDGDDGDIIWTDPELEKVAKATREKNLRRAASRRKK